MVEACVLLRHCVQTLAMFGRQYKPPELKQLGFDSPQLNLLASMDSTGDAQPATRRSSSANDLLQCSWVRTQALQVLLLRRCCDSLRFSSEVDVWSVSTERAPGMSALNWSPAGPAGKGVNSIHVSDAGSERTSDHSGSDSSSEVADSQAGGDDESFSHVPPSPSPAFMRSKALYTTNSAAVRGTRHSPLSPHCGRPSALGPACSASETVSAGGRMPWGKQLAVTSSCYCGYSR